MRFRSLAAVVIMAVIVAGSAQLVDAFYDDTHYSLTYYIARSCGYTPLQAFRAASANVGVDYSPLTEPVQGDRVTFSAFEPDSAQDARVRFHAMWDNRIDTAHRELGNAANRGRELQLWQLATAQKNPGVLLHFIQDEEPHAGYQSWGGHWFPSSLIEARTSGLPWGSTTDYLSYNQQHSVKMVDSTIKTLREFMRRMSLRQRSGGARCDVTAMLPVLNALVRVNPRPLLAEEQYKLKIAEMIVESGADKLNLTQEQFRALLQKARLDLPTPTAGPQTPQADREIARALGEREIEPYRSADSRARYTYNATGVNPLNDLPPFALYGTLTATLAGAEGRKVGVSVWAAPTRIGDKPYQLTDCKESAYRFDNLPVGDLIVQSVVDGKVTRKNVRLERSEQGLQINIAPAKKEEPSDKCNKEAAEMAAQACGMQKNPAGDVDQPRAFEDQFEQKLDDCKQEEEKRNTEQQEAANQTPTPTTPVNSGGGTSIGKIVGWTALLGGSIVGGLYVASELEAISELDTFTGSSNTTTTTNNNPAPVSNTPSTIGLGSFNCSVANDTSGFRNCTGTVNIRAGTLLAARQGTTISVVTTPSFFATTFIAPGLGGTTGTVSLRATMPRTCAVQTFVSFFVPGSNLAFESIEQIISVGCP